jgi:hypothetical protein
MRETTMKRNPTFIVLALGAAVLLAGCNSKSPTAPKPTPIPAFNLTLTPEATTANAGTYVRVDAAVTKQSGGNAADGTAVTFDVNGGQFTDAGATEVVRTTTGGAANVLVTGPAGSALILGRVPGGSAETSIAFTGVPPTPTPTGPPDYTPQIFALTPNAGPFQGGTQVTITGTGFQYPVQVLFDDVQAQVVSTTYTQIVCISPSITPSAPTDVVNATVTVTDINNGRVSNGVLFRYGVTMFISAINPPVGPQDTATTVTITGQGFVAPVSITIGGISPTTTWDVLQVAGTEIVARTRPLLPDNLRSCDNLTATVTVTNLDTGAQSNPAGQFTYQATRPLITSVQIDGGGNYVQQFVSGTCTVPWTSHTVTINGSGFEQGMTVRFEGGAGGSAGPVVATYLDSHTLTLTLPDLTGLGLQTVTCNDGAGTGQRNVATPVGVTVINPHNSCEDTLGGAIVINPCVTTCQILAAPTVTSVAPDNGPIAGGTSVIITGTNFVNSGLSVTIGGAPATGVSFIDATHIQATTPAHTPAGAVAVTVFCGGQNGTNPTAFTYTADMAMTIAGVGQVAALPVPFVGTSPCTDLTTPCAWTFNQSVVQLTVTTGGTFNGWSGATCGCTGTTTPCNVTMNQNRACTATFTP